MIDEDFYNKINDLKADESFRNSINITDTKTEIEFPMELILRYFILKHNNIKFEEYNMSSDLLSSFIDRETTNLIKDETFKLDLEIEIFKRTFKLLDEVLGGSSFRKYNFDKSSFEGGFIQYSFEGILPGLANNIDYYESDGKGKLRDKIVGMYSNEDFIDNSKRGSKALPRIQGMIAFSNKYFSDHES